MKNIRNLISAISARNGSTLVGVIVAMVFTGIVATTMVKNTASQSASSRGYAGYVSTGITAMSGAVATESFFSNPNNAETLLERLNDTLSPFGQQRTFVNGNPKLASGNRQYFNSTLADTNGTHLSDNPDSSFLLSMFEIDVGNKQNGNNPKRMTAFYRLGNLRRVSVDEVFGGSNAIYMGGDLSNGDNGMHVNGRATFDGPAKFQNSPGIFTGDVYFGSNVEFNNPGNRFGGNVYIKGRAQIVNKSDFDKDVYIDSTMEIASNAGGTQFNGKCYVKSRASIGTVSSDNLVFNDDAYFGGTLRIDNVSRLQFNRTHVGDTLSIQNQSASHRPFLDNISIYGRFGTTGTNAVNAGGDVYIGGAIETNLNMVMFPDSVFNSGTSLYDYTPNTFRYTTAITTSLADSRVTGVTRNGVPVNPDKEQISLPHFVRAVDSTQITRLQPFCRDPRIDITRVGDTSTAKSLSSFGNGGNITVDNLHKAWEEKNKHLFWNGHLVVVHRRNESVNMGSGLRTGTVFKEKIIIIIAEGATLNVGQDFYRSADTASTLIYVGRGKAALDQFGTDNLFRGLVYIAHDNTTGATTNENSSSFNWRAGGKIEGAVHNHSSNRFRWNGGTNNAVPIERKGCGDDVLNNFAGLRTVTTDCPLHAPNPCPPSPCAPGGGGSGRIELADGMNFIDVTPLGYYFY
ncbi:MAG: hypothetical protein LBI42_02495 [Chitinispirillales bacterium]|jgi:hypothetical protein|nr:hypothetical protein [Chitinispirillales bacterium]